MSEVQVKFFSTDRILFQEQAKAEEVVKDDFQTYVIKINVHHIDILENKNQILCTFFCDISDYVYDEKQLILKIFLNEKVTPTPLLLLEIHSHSPDILLEIIENINDRKSFVKFKGPLSYNPAKMNRTSLLSTESPEQNFRGFLNAAGLVLIANNIRSIIDNAEMYGIQFHKIWIAPANYLEPAALAIVCGLAVQVLVAYGIQRLNFSGKINPRTTWILNFVNIMLVLLNPVIFKQFYEIHPFPSIFIIVMSCVIWLKLISYAHVWRNVYFLVQRIKEFQCQTQENNKNPLLIITESEASSDNFEVMKKNYENPISLLRLADLCYFLAAPTLCFQMIYPRTQRIRRIWLFKRFIELILTLLFQTVLWFQYLNPLLEETYELQKNPKNNNILFVFERMLKLSIPNLYFWVSGFFLLFQVFLNITAEILRYGDRQFYLDWWNCRDLEQYWRLWNLPVHNWCVRHFYNPLLKRGISKEVSNLLVFTLSAFLHEWIISGSMSIIGYHAFFAMWLQAPIIMLQRRITKVLKLENSSLGNLMFWVSFCFIGQPAAVLLYYEIYRNKYG